MADHEFLADHHNWVDSADWKESDLAMMKPKEKERYERFY
jgi:hypothetical protein